MNQHKQTLLQYVLMLLAQLKQKIEIFFKLFFIKGRCITQIEVFLLLLKQGLHNILLCTAQNEKVEDWFFFPQTASAE